MHIRPRVEIDSIGENHHFDVNATRLHNIVADANRAPKNTKIDFQFSYANSCDVYSEKFSISDIFNKTFTQTVLYYYFMNTLHDKAILK